MENKPKTLWFRAKTYGWGWTPCSWQGWTVLGVWLLLNLFVFIRVNAPGADANDLLLPFFGVLIPSTIVLIVICYRTGEKPGWRWGRKK